MIVDDDRHDSDAAPLMNGSLLRTVCAWLC